MKKNVSGQFVYFFMNSAISGNPVTNISGFISGRKCLDGLSGMIVLSGNIIELGGGAYRANLYAFDTNGDQAGFLFTASGCVPFGVQFDMIDGNGSGAVYLSSGQSVAINSGQNVRVYSGQLSGQIIDAHLTRLKDFSPIRTPIVSGVIIADASFASGVELVGYDFLLASGTATTIQLPSADAAGITITDNGQYEWTTFYSIGDPGKNQQVRTTTKTSNPREYNVLSGTMPTACTSGTPMIFGETWAVASGRVWLSSGHQAALYSGQVVSLYSGSLSGQPAGTATVQSGASVIATLYSGQIVAMYSGQLSGQPVNLLSGNTVAVLSGTNVNLFSGTSVNVYSGQLSGQQVNLHSGNVVAVLSGTNVNLFSGLNVNVYSGQLSGQQVNLLSGNTVAVLSGTNVNLFSGLNVRVYSGQLSGHPVNPLSGNNVVTATLLSGEVVSLFSGVSVNVYSGQLSGFQVTARTVSDKSGYTVGTNLDKSGYGVGSGDVFVASGTVLASVLSGTVWLASGHGTTIYSGQTVSLYSGQTVSLYSGQSVRVYSGQLSGHPVNPLSGNNVVTATLLSGEFVNVYSGQLSGQVQASVASGLVFLNSGWHRTLHLADHTQYSGIFASGMSGRNDITAHRKLNNKWALTSGTFTSYAEDDVTVSMVQLTTALSGAAPITSMDTQ